jgi:origin recognition complex subunit 3
LFFRSESKPTPKKAKKKSKQQTSDDEDDSEPDNPDESGKPEKLSEEGKLQARFSRAVSELQFLGYIRPSKRKTDHVERLALHT